jgi:hypothetical protein
MEWIHRQERELFELWGIDSMQALQLAILAAGDLVNGYGEALRWVGGEGGYLGFPGTYPADLPKPVLRRLERLINREIASHTRQLAKRKRHERRRRLKTEPAPLRGKRAS